jgi:hypothetical protein
MITRVISILCSLALMASPAFAYEYEPPAARPYGGGNVMVACLDDTADATTYNSAAWQALSTGRSDTDSVAVMVGVMGEDGTATFGVNSVSIDGVAGVEISDEDGSGVVDTAIWRSNAGAPSNTSFYKNMAQVNISVTFSEAVTGAAVCVFTFTMTEAANTGSPTLGLVVDDDTGSGALVLTLTSATPIFATKTMFGVCMADTTGQSTTWAILNETVDTSNAEFSYSAAYLTVPDATTYSSAAITCDYTGTGDASGTASNH